MAIKKLPPQIIDTVTENGEFVERTVIENEVYVKDNEEFSMLFRKYQGAILGIDVNEIKVLLWCVYNCAFNTGEVVINKAIKERIMESTKLKKSSISNALTKLVQRKMLYRPFTGVYVVNPTTTWTGKLSKRDKLIEVYTKFHIENPDQE